MKAMLKAISTIALLTLVSCQSESKQGTAKVLSDEGHPLDSMVSDTNVLELAAPEVVEAGEKKRIALGDLDLPANVLVYLRASLQMESASPSDVSIKTIEPCSG